jgi:anti-sigma factor RsiW
MRYDLEKIHAYIDNELSPEERKSFEAELIRDAQLAQQVARLKRFKETTRGKWRCYAEENFLEECLETLSERAYQERTEQVVYRLRFAFAGVVLFALILNGVLHRLYPRPEVNAPALAQMLNAPPSKQIHVSPGYHSTALGWLQDQMGTPIDFPRFQNPRLMVLAMEVVRCHQLRVARFLLTDGEMVCTLIFIPQDITVCGEPVLAKGECYYYAVSWGPINAVWWKEGNCTWILSGRVPTERLLQMVSP